MNRIQQDFIGGIENYNLGLLPQAKLMFLDCIKQAPGHAEAHNLLGMTCFRRKEYREAMQYLTKACELQPNEIFYYNNAGVVAYALKDYQKAKTLFLTAIKFNPAYPDPYNNLGNLLSDLLLFDEAVKFYKQALTLNPGFAQACFNLALALEKRHYDIEAIFYYQQTIKIKPDYLKAHQALTRLLPDYQGTDQAQEHRQEVAHLLPLQPRFYIHTPFWTPPDYKGLFKTINMT